MIERLTLARELWTLLSEEDSGKFFPCLLEHCFAHCVPLLPCLLYTSEFHLLNGRNRMITKMPVRLLTLSMLTLREKKSFWDIGFCTGSVSIEAKLQFPELKVTAFEQRPEGKELMARNSRKFGTPGITTVMGDFL